MSIRPRHVRIAFAITVIVAVGATAGAAIAYVTHTITGRASPLPAAPPWEWSGTDIAQWFSNRADADSVVNVVTQVLATIVWLAVIYVAWKVMSELIDQARHGIVDTRAPHTRQRSSTRRARPAFASSVVALLLGASTITASTVGAVGLPQRAPTVIVADTATAVDATVANIDTTHNNPFEVDVNDASGLPAGMRWHDYTATRADESLRSIATDISGDGGLARFIWTTNQHRQVSPGTTFNDPTIVRQGWTLRIPVPVGAVDPTPATPRPNVADAEVHHDDQVEQGDTLWDMVDDVVDEPVTMTLVDAVAVDNDGVTSPDGTFVFSAANPDLIHPGQVFDLQPAIDRDTHAVTEPAVIEPDVDQPVDEPPPPAAPNNSDEPVAAPAPDVPSADDTGDNADSTMDADDRGAVDDPAVVDASIGSTHADRIEVDDPVDIDKAVEASADIAVDAEPVPAVTSPAPPTPIPSNVVELPLAQPGDSAATPPPPDTTNLTDANDGLPIMLLAAGGLSLAGLFITLDRKRRIARASRPLGRAVAPTDPIVERSEQAIRSAAHIDRAMRVNLAIRQLGAHLAERDAPLRSRYILADSTTVTVVFDTLVELADDWIDGPIPHSWTCAVSDTDLEAFCEMSTPWPALVPIGTLDDGTDVLVDVEGLGVLGITGSEPVVGSVLSALVASLASSPYADLLTLVDDNSVGLHGLDAHLQHRLAVDSVDTLIDRLGAWIAPLDLDDQHLIAARHEFGGEFEPCIAAVACDLSDVQRSVLAALPFDGSRPVALITTDTDLATTVLDVGNDATTVLDGHRVRLHRLEPVAAVTAAQLFETADVLEVSDHSPLDDYRTVVTSPDADHAAQRDQPDHDEADTAPVGVVAAALGIVHRSQGVPPVPAQLFDTEPDIGWHVRNLGPLEIVHTDGTHLTKLRELFTLLGMHPAGLTAHEVTDKLNQSKDPNNNDLDASDNDDDLTGGKASKPAEGRRARFSDLRKVLGHGDALIGRSYLPMHSKARGYHVEGIRVDSVRFVKCLEAAQGAAGQDKINWLVGALQLVRGQINTGELTKYAWASRILLPLEASIVDAGIELAQLAADSGNWAVADWAASQVRVANPYDQRGLPIQVQARQALGDEVGIRRLHDEAIDTVDELDPDVHEVFIHALAR